MAIFRTKPVEIEAIQCREAHYKMGHNWYSLPKWFIDAYEGRNENGVRTIIGINHPEPCIEIITTDCILKANIDDWIVKEINGAISPCKPEAFKQKYDFVQD